MTLANCNTPPEPKWFFRAILFLTIVSWILVLSGCSTQRAQVPFNPPHSALMKSVPLPALQIDEAAPDNAPSTVGLAELAEDNLTITGMYRALAKRHDALVDAALEYMTKQSR